VPVRKDQPAVNILPVAADASRRKLVFGPSSGPVPCAFRLFSIVKEHALSAVALEKALPRLGFFNSQSEISIPQLQPLLPTPKTILRYSVLSIFTPFILCSIFSNSSEIISAWGTDAASRLLQSQ
jgi:hypothetical protein